MIESAIGYYVYELIDPRTNSVRYIGYTNNPHSRLRSHCNNPCSIAMKSWIAELKSHGLRPIIKVVCEFADCQEAEEFERLHIKEMGTMLKGNLLNFSMHPYPAEVVRSVRRPRPEAMRRTTVKSIRFTEKEWAYICRAAAVAAIDPNALVRQAAMQIVP